MQCSFFQSRCWTALLFWPFCESELSLSCEVQLHSRAFVVWKCVFSVHVAVLNSPTSSSSADWLFVTFAPIGAANSGATRRCTPAGPERAAHGLEKTVIYAAQRTLRGGWTIISTEQCRNVQLMVMTVVENKEKQSETNNYEGLFSIVA